MKHIYFLLLVLVIAFYVYINFFTVYLHGLGVTTIKFVSSAVVVIAFYLLNRIVETIIISKVTNNKERYTFRKIISTATTIIVVGILFAIWFRETTNLIIAYGILSAGIAIALQDILKSIAGGIILLISRPFVAGDRIQVEDIVGDVLDIRNFSTTIMEIREWVDADQYTGRIIHLPNSFILNKTIKNYTRDFSFIWDEIQIMVVYGSNLKKAEDITLKVAKEVTKEFEESAKKELKQMGGKYFITTYDVETKLFMKQADNWIDMRLRYVLNPRQRRIISTKLIQRIVEALDAEDDIILGTATSIDVMERSSIKVEGFGSSK